MVTHMELVKEVDQERPGFKTFDKTVMLNISVNQASHPALDRTNWRNAVRNLDCHRVKTSSSNGHR